MVDCQVPELMVANLGSHRRCHPRCHGSVDRVAALRMHGASDDFKKDPFLALYDLGLFGLRGWCGKTLWKGLRQRYPLC
jgi:hypothetical protein